MLRRAVQNGRVAQATQDPYLTSRVAILQHFVKRLLTRQSEGPTP
jgi:hypothetical protein